MLDRLSKVPESNLPTEIWEHETLTRMDSNEQQTLIEKLKFRNNSFTGDTENSNTRKSEETKGRPVLRDPFYKSFYL